ncbi:9911_t:CDS:2, partial [Cetraspora pellucida]
MSFFDESPIDIKIETPESDIEKNEVVDSESENIFGSFIILLKIEYSHNPITSIYKIIDESGVSLYIKFDKNNQTFIEAAYNKLCEYFEPDYDRLESVYSGKKVNKKNIITYYLNDLEYSILETKYILDIIDLNTFSDEFEFKNDAVKQKILNKSERLNNDYYKDYIEKRKRNYNEISIGENAVAKILKRYNNENSGTSIRITQKIEITKRSSPFVFGFVGAPGVGKTTIINKIKDHLISIGIGVDEIYISKELRDIISEMNKSKTKNNIQNEITKYYKKFLEDTVQKKMMIGIKEFINNIDFDLIINIERSKEDVLKVRNDDENYSEFEITKLYYRYNIINEEDYDNTKIFTFDNHGEFNDEKNNILVDL